MKKSQLFPFLTPEQNATVEASVSTYRGQSDTISDALGALAFGQFYGWRGLYMAHGRQKIRRFEAVLGIRLRESMPERTDLSERILGVRVADEIGKFWAVVKGDVSVRGGKRHMDDLAQADLFAGPEAVTTK